MLSSAVSVTDAPVSPIYLSLGIGVAALARWGRSLWPAFVVGDAVGLTVTLDRSPAVAALSLILHVATLLVGAWLVRSRRAWLEDVGGAARYIGIAGGLSVLGATTGLLVLWLGNGLRNQYGPFGDFMVWMLGDLGGYLVAGVLLLAWSRPGARRELARRPALAGFGVVCLIGVSNLLFPGPLLGVLGLLVAGLMAMRFGVRWGSASASAMLIVLVLNAARGVSGFGGVTPAAEAFNAVLAVAIAAGASLLLGGYREGPLVGPPSTKLVVVITAATMVGGGIATFASSQLTLDRGFPLATAALFFLASAVSIALVRGARTPRPASTRRGIGIAVVGGALSVAGLGLYFESLPDLGVGSATGLAMTAPAFIVLIAAGLSRRLPPLLTSAGCAAIAVGAVAIAVAGGGSGASGVLFALGGALVFATFVTLLVVALRHAHPVDVATAVATSACVFGAVLAFVVEGPDGFGVSLPAFGVIAFGAIAGGALPTLMRAWSLPWVGPPVVGALGVLSPVTTIVFSMLLLGADRTPLEVVGVVVIALGAATAALAPILRPSRLP